MQRKTPLIPMEDFFEIPKNPRLVFHQMEIILPT